MEARQRAQLTGTNRSFDLIALVAKARARRRTTDDRGRIVLLSFVSIVRQRQEPVLLLSDDRRRTTDDGGAQAFPSSVVRPPPSEPSFAGLVALARRSDPIPSRTRPSNAFAPMVLCLKTWESRSSPGLQRTESQRFKYPSSSTIGQSAIGSRLPAAYSLPIPSAAGWSSPVARQAHNLKAAGSNPAPATKLSE